MLTAVIEQAGDVNGFLFDAIAQAEQQPTVDAAAQALCARLSRSHIYRVVRETPETVAVRSFFRRRVVARVGAV